MKLVSVIIPTYKRSTHLGRAIDSVLEQDYENVEIVVVDDNNGEDAFRKDTEQLMERYADNERVKYLKHPHNMNGSAARNTGINNSRGEYIAFLDDDDYFTKSHISRCVKYLESSNNEIGGCCENSLKTYKNLIYKQTDYEGISSSCYELLSGLIDYGAGSTLVIKREVIDRIGLFDTSFKRHQDWEFLIRIFRNYKISSLPEIGTIQCADGVRNFPNTTMLIEMKKKIFFTFERDINSLGENKRGEVRSAQLLEVFSSYVISRKYSTAYDFYRYYRKNEKDFLKGRSKYITFYFLIGLFPSIRIFVYWIRHFLFLKDRYLLR